MKIERPADAAQGLSLFPYSLFATPDSRFSLLSDESS